MRSPDSPIRSARLAALATILVLYLVLGTIHLIWGSFTYDEGIYALAARHVGEGMRPYRDFLFQQMPLLPYVYAAWFSLAGASIESARLLSLLLGGAALILTLLSCHRRGGWQAALVGGLLLGLNLSFVFDAVTFKTQPLTLFLISASLFCISSTAAPHSALRAALAMGWMSLAFLARLSMLPALFCLWAYLIWEQRRQPAAVLGLVLLDIVLVLLALAHFNAEGNMLFGVYELHNYYPETSLFSSFLSNWLKNQGPLLLCLLGTAVYFLTALARNGLQGTLQRDTALLFFLLAAYASTTLIHCINTRSYATHQTSNMPFAVMFSSVVLSALLERCTAARQAVLLASLTVMALIAMPGQQWEVRLNGDGTTRKIAEVVQIVRQHSKPGDSLLSFNSELAVESGLKALPGYNLGRFGYFPDMPDDRAARLHALNFNRLYRDIGEGRGEILCTSSRELSGMAQGSAERFDQLKAAMERNYEQKGVVTRYGQFSEDIFILSRKARNERF